MQPYVSTFTDRSYKMRRYFVFVTAGLSLLMYSIDATAVAVALPRFIKELDTTVLWAAWTMSLFFIGVVMAMPLAGNLSDSFGRKRFFCFPSFFSLPVLSRAALRPISTP